jgi:hypothetical protein
VVRDVEYDGLYTSITVLNIELYKLNVCPHRQKATRFGDKNQAKGTKKPYSLYNG